LFSTKLVRLIVSKNNAFCESIFSKLTHIVINESQLYGPERGTNLPSLVPSFIYIHIGLSFATRDSRKEKQLVALFGKSSSLCVAAIKRDYHPHSAISDVAS
jgi:hypothetical protein